MPIPVHAKNRLAHTHKKKFLIVSTRRVGSTALALTLSDTPGVRCDKEMLFARKPHPSLQDKHVGITKVNDIHQFLETSSEATSGSKLTIPEYQAPMIDEICRLLIASEVSVVHLTRPLLLQYVSLRHAQKNKVWHSAKRSVPDWVQPDHPVPTKAANNAKEVGEEVEKFCREVMSVDTAIARLAHSLPYFHVAHAKINDRDALLKLGNFLGIKDTIKPNHALLRTTTDHTQFFSEQPEVLEVFSNYESIHQQSLLAN
ncbi:hypothetical protein OCL06_10380 [Alteromonas sp. ASW11-19]|uniref:Sulphotransferase Stf0 domain-containing protein n=1 Tax=Alteromonas salexigens TaxID=2982530 RepID=A0ABT2VNX0_9ALTE|nr:hypothetical protein [Alteromonas salexigens]MCU7555007.1 hypothetical protein [Alteromonas salexigens]